MSHQILVIDDEQDVGDVVKDLLEYEGFTTSIARTGQEALDILATKVFRGVIIDLRLEGSLSGFDIIRFLIKKESRPVIFVTSGTPKGTLKSVLEKEGLSDWVDGLLEKPSDLTPDNLVSIIRRHIK